MKPSLVVCGGCRSVLLDSSGGISCSVCGRSLTPGIVHPGAVLWGGAAYPLEDLMTSDRESASELMAAMDSQEFRRAARILDDGILDGTINIQDAGFLVAGWFLLSVMRGDGVDGKFVPVLSIGHGPSVSLAVFRSLTANRDLMDTGQRIAALDSIWSTSVETIPSEHNLPASLVIMSISNDIMGEIAEGLSGVDQDILRKRRGFLGMFDSIVSPIVSQLSLPYLDEAIGFWRRADAGIDGLFRDSMEAYLEGDPARSGDLAKGFVIRYLSMDRCRDILASNGDVSGCTDFLTTVITDQSGAIVRDLEGSCSGEPWWPVVVGAVGRLGEDVFDVRAELTGILEAHPDKDAEIRKCICSEAVQWLRGLIASGGVYDGEIDGIYDLFPCVDPEGPNDRSYVLLQMIFLCGNESAAVDDASGAKALFRTVVSLTCGSLSASSSLMGIRSAASAAAFILFELGRRFRDPSGDRDPMMLVARFLSDTSLLLEEHLSDMGGEVADLRMAMRYKVGALSRPHPDAGEILGEFYEAAVLRAISAEELEDEFAGRMESFVELLTEPVSDPFPEDMCDGGPSDCDTVCETTVPVSPLSIACLLSDPVYAVHGSTSESVPMLFIIGCDACGCRTLVSTGSVDNRCGRCGKRIDLSGEQLERMKALRERSIDAADRARKDLSEGRLRDAVSECYRTMDDDPMCWQCALASGMANMSAGSNSDAFLDWTRALLGLRPLGRDEFDEFYVSVLGQIRRSIRSGIASDGTVPAMTTLPDFALVLRRQFPDMMSGRDLIDDLLAMLSEDIGCCGSTNELRVLLQEMSQIVLYKHYCTTDLREHIRGCAIMIAAAEKADECIGSIGTTSASKAAFSATTEALRSMYSAIQKSLSDGIEGMSDEDVDEIAGSWGYPDYYALADMFVGSCLDCMDLVRRGKGMTTDAMGRVDECVRIYLGGPTSF